MNSETERALQLIREALSGTPYEGQVYLVGGYVRDKLLNRPLPHDVDLVLEGDALALAQFLYEKGVADHAPVVYPRFGTAQVHVAGVPTEIVTARAESYRSDSRKPIEVKPATLREDAERRDFTVNTLMENLHTGEIVDPLGTGLSDLQARILRTPREPVATFYEDPLRMLRAVRFATQLRFEIEPATYSAIKTDAERLRVISIERIREEFTKILEQENAHEGLQMLLDTGLLAIFGAPLLPMVGCTQNDYHLYDVWEHSLKAVSALSTVGKERNFSVDWELRLATLLHDVGKPATRTVDPSGEVHFYGHAELGAEITENWLRDLRYSNATIERVSKLVRMHMRPGAYSSNWSDSAIRRLIRDAGTLLEPLLLLCEADARAQRPDVPKPDLDGLRERIGQVRASEQVERWRSPLSGTELMELFGLKPGPLLGQLKNYLQEQVLEGNLHPDDKQGAFLMASEFLNAQERA